MTLYTNDKIILKATNLNGFICDKNQLVYFKEMNGTSYKCSLGSEYPTDATFTIPPQQVLFIIDSITNEIKYKHDPNDAL